MNKIFLLVLMCAVMNAVAQDIPKTPKDDPQARYEFEVLRLRNPVSKQMPENMRFRELNFSRALSDQVRTEGTPSTWAHRGPFNVGGRTRALAVDVNTEMTILAGGVSGGVWKSTNQGASWTKTTSPGDLQSATAIAQDTRAGQTDIWYYATGEKRGNSARGFGAPFSGSGIFKSTDGGNSWNLLPNTSDGLPQDDSDDFDYNHELVVNPINGDVYVANEGGIYRSQNGGTSFSLVLNDASKGWSDVAISPTGIIYAAIDDVGVWMSLSGDANSWAEISAGTGITKVNGERKELAISASNENIVYLLMEDDTRSFTRNPDTPQEEFVAGHALWRYDKSIDTWEDRSENIPLLAGLTGDFTSQGGYDLLIKVRPTDENFVVIGGTNLFKSTDGFVTSFNTPSSNNPNWIGGYTASNGSYGLYPNHHPDQHAFVFLSDNKALSGNDGGVQLTSDVTSSSVSWSWLNNGYLTTQSYAVSVGPGDQIMSGFQDNSTWLTTSTSPTFTWTDQFGGDGAYNAFSADGTIRFMSSQNANIYRVNYGTADSHSPTGFTSFAPDAGYSSALFIAPFYLDPQNDELFYLGGDFDFYVNNQASTGSGSIGWSSVPIDNSGAFTEIGVTNFNQVLVGTHIGEIFRVTDPGGSAVVEEITGSNFPSAYVSGIASNPFNANEILVSFSNYEVQSLFHTANGGVNWTHVSGNLEEDESGSGDGPSVRFAAIVGNGDKYFAATSTGLYTTTVINGSSTNWTREDEAGIGNVVVEHLASRTDGLIVAGTHANGIYSSNVDIQNVLANDLAVTNISEPIDGILGVESVRATVINVGSSTQTTFNLSLFINNNLVVTDPVTVSLPGLESYEHTFTQNFDFSSSGTYDIRVKVDLPGDSNSSNDEYTEPVETIETLSSFPYTESFESNEHGWTSSGTWELGSPSTQLLSGASQGAQAWATDLDGDYDNSELAQLESPLFNFSNLTSPVISFDINYSTETNFDGAVFGYRTNSIDAYTVIFDNSNTTNWYSGAADVFGHDAWQGSTSGSYTNASVEVSNLAGNNGVQFALIFKSDETITEEGIAFDNFRIFENTSPSDIQLTSSQIDENEPAGTVVGILSALDGDDIAHTFTLVSGDGDTDNANFDVVGTELRSITPFNFEVQETHAIRLRAEDDDQNSIEEEVIISIVDDPDDEPTDISLSSMSILENEIVGTTVGTLSTTDLDDSQHTYSFLDVGNVSNESFSIDDNSLKSAEVFDFETETSYIIRVQTMDDDGNEFAKLLSIEILNDESDDPLAINTLTENGISVFPNPVKNRLNLDMVNDYFGQVKISVFSIEGSQTIVERIVNKTGYSMKGLFDLNTLSKGLYILRFEMGDKVLTGKIIKD